MFSISTAKEKLSGNGSSKVFEIKKHPYQVYSIRVADRVQKVGVKGASEFGCSVLVDGRKGQMIFVDAPEEGKDNIAIEYSYQALTPTPDVARLCEFLINLTKSGMSYEAIAEHGYTFACEEVRNQGYTGSSAMLDASKMLEKAVTEINLAFLISQRG